MTTFTGKRVKLLSPSVDDIDIQDIAHALSHLCRFTGHCARFYSVAEHCWAASHLVEREFALEALLHDAAEAYINDLSRPLKHLPSMSEYLVIEQRFEAAIAVKLGLPATMSPAVKVTDNRLVVTEARQLLRDHRWTEDLLGYAGWCVEGLDPRAAKAAFLFRFKELYAQPQV